MRWIARAILQLLCSLCADGTDRDLKVYCNSKKASFDSGVVKGVRERPLVTWPVFTLFVLLFCVCFYFTRRTTALSRADLRTELKIVSALRDFIVVQYTDS